MSFKESSIHFKKEVPNFKSSKVRIIYRNSNALNDIVTDDVSIAIPVTFSHIFLYSKQGKTPYLKKELSGIPSAKGLFKDLAKVFFNLYLHLSRPIKIEHEAFIYDLRDFYPNNIAHLLAEIIPICLTIKSAVAQNVIFLIEPPLKEPFRNLLNYFDINTIQSNKKFLGKKLEFRVERSLSAFNFNYRSGGIFGSHPVCYLHHVYDSYNIPEISGFEKIFLSRKDQRALVNKVEIESFLAKKGFKTIYLEDHPIEMQIKISASAKFVVGIHGAAMAYLLLSKSIKHVIEILPPNVHHEYFPLILDSKKDSSIESFTQIIASFDDKILCSEWDEILHFKNTPFTLDETLLEHALKAINS